MKYSIVIEKCFSTKSKTEDLDLVSEIKFAYTGEKDGLTASIPCVLNFDNSEDSDRLFVPDITQAGLEKMIALKLDVTELNSELQQLIAAQESKQQEVPLV